MNDNEGLLHSYTLMLKEVNENINMSSEKSTSQGTKSYLDQQKEVLIMKLKNMKELEKDLKKKLVESKKRNKNVRRKSKIMASWTIIS